MQYLDLEVRLLVLRYGYNRIIEALSRAKGVTEDEIQAAIADLDMSKTSKRAKSSKKAISEIAEKYVERTPDKAELLRELVVRFENRTFLPQMQDVRHFLVPFGIDPKSLKSRRESTAKLFEKLSEMPSRELQELIAYPPNQASAYSELAKEIIGDNRRR